MAEEGHEVEVPPGPAAAAAAAPASARRSASTASPPLLTGKEQIHELDVTDMLFNDILFVGVVAHW